MIEGSSIRFNCVKNKTGFCRCRALLVSATLACLFAIYTPQTFGQQAKQDLEVPEQRVALNDLSVKAWIEPKGKLVVSQQALLYIEVSTPDWFSAGTKIGSFEIDDVVVLRREKFSVNSTRREGAETRATQLWSISLYPQREGSFLVPEIELVLSTVDKHSKAKQTILRTKPIDFTVVVPDEVKTQLGVEKGVASNWIATNRFTLDQRFSRQLTELEVGDSVTRVIEINSQNVAAMMLPTVHFDSQAGLAAYHAPVQLKDRVNRGDYLASRLESVSYVVEQPGVYRLPQIEFYWWDINAEVLQHEVIPSVTVSTRGQSIDSANSAGSSSLEVTDERELPNLILYSLFGLLALMAFFWAAKLYGRRNNSSQQVLVRELSELEKEYSRYCLQREYGRASAVLYQWFHSLHRLRSETAIEPSLRLWLREHDNGGVLVKFDQLMKTAHSKQKADNVHVNHLESLMQDIRNLFLQVHSKHSVSHATDFRLN